MMSEGDYNNGMSRKDFVRYVLIAVGVSAVAGSTYLFTKRVDLSKPFSIETIRNQLSDVENDLRLIGEKYLEDHPEDVTQAALLKEINSKLSSAEINQGLFSDLMDLIGQQIDLDFKNSDFVNIEGWILTKTEALISALIAT